MFKTITPLILASGSPRRSELLSRLCIDFSVVVPEVDESWLVDEPGDQYVRRMAQLKGAMVGRLHAPDWILSADTVVIAENRLLTKPESPEQAEVMLMLLSGKTHQVITGFCLSCPDQEVHLVDSVLSIVRFKAFPESWARSYVETGEPMDKAGAYGIQGRGGVLVESVTGSYSNVVGLPLAEVVELLCQYRVVLPVAEEADEDSNSNKG